MAQGRVSADDTLSPSLKYYAEKLRPQQSLQLVLHLDRAQEKSGIKIARLDRWLESLDSDRLVWQQRVSYTSGR